MVDPLGAVTGILGLYCVCLQLMNQIDDARNFEGDFAKLQTIFQSERILFERWGKFVGLGTKDDSKRHRCILKDAAEYQVIEMVLKELEIVWRNSGRFFETVEIRESTDTNGANTHQGPSVRRRLLWAFKDKRKFECLLTDIGILVQKLYNLVTPQDAMVEDMKNSLEELAAHMDENAKERAEQGQLEHKFRSDVSAYITDMELEKLLDWIGAISTEDRYDEAKRARHPNTCVWFQSNRKFLNWTSPPYGISRVLWLWGVAGIGKTHLSASIIDYLQKHSPHPTAFFFCTHEHEKKNQPISILRSWISQLVVLDPDALEVALKMKVKHRDLVWSLLWELFRDIILRLESCNLVIDGYDECLDRDPASKISRSGERRAFLDKLLESTVSTSAKILVISRDLPSIRSSLMHTGHNSKRSLVSDHSISTQDTGSDIASYAHWIAESKFESHVGRSSVSNRLLEGCGGMFLRLRLVGEQLESGMLRDDLEKILRSMPPGLDQAYKRNILEVSRMDKGIRDRVVAILRWTLFAFRPLSVIELLHAIRSENAPSSLPTVTDITEDLIQNIILKPCGSLIEVRKSSDPHHISERTVHLVHRSVKEFLTNEQEECAEPLLAQFFFMEQKAHHNVLHQICLSYLVAQSNSDRAFTLYCAKHWTDHYNEAGEELGSSSIHLQRLLFVEGRVFDHWVKSYEGTFRPWEHLTIESKDRTTPLDAACWYGMRGIYQELLAREGRVPQNALHIAAYRGHETMVQLLLARGDVDVNAPYRRHTPLRIASYMGNIAVVQLLLGCPDILVNLTHEDQLTPLFIACLGKHKNIVRLLLARPEVDVNQCRTNGTGTPLEGALHSDSIPILEMLLAHKDININAVDINGCTALDRTKNITEMSREFAQFDRLRLLTRLGKGSAEIMLRKAGGKTGAELRITEVPAVKGDPCDTNDDIGKQRPESGRTHLINTPAEIDTETSLTNDADLSSVDSTSEDEMTAVDRAMQDIERAQHEAINHQGLSFEPQSFRYTLPLIAFFLVSLYYLLC